MFWHIFKTTSCFERSGCYKVSPLATIMNSQSKISSFFKSKPDKRRSSTECDTNEKHAKFKKQKCDPSITTTPVKCAVASTPVTPKDELKISDDESDDGKQKTQPSATPLTPKQKEIIDEKRLTAQMKLAQKSTHGLVIDFGVTWFNALQAEFTKPYFQELSKHVHDTRQKCTVYPPPGEVFTFTRACEINEVKVVILGQDPYHGDGQAHGLSFSVKRGIKTPPSLENMYKELITDIEGFKHPKHGNLTGWAEQGVLMLNACLTVTAHKANSHAGKGWETFTDTIIAWLNSKREGIVFILWGNYAQKKGARINKTRHRVLTGVHPSPLSANRGGFFGSKPYSRCNTYLSENGKKPIDWTHLPQG